MVKKTKNHSAKTSLIGQLTNDGKVIIAIYDKNPDNRFNNAWMAVFHSLDENGRLIYEIVNEAWISEGNSCGTLLAELSEGTYFGHFRPDSRCEKSVVWFGQWKNREMIELNEKEIKRQLSQS